MHRVAGGPHLSVRALAVALLAITLALACGPRPRVAPAPQTLYVATSGDYAPFSAWEGGRPTGFAPALLEAFAERADARLAWTRFRWTDAAAGMREARWDVVADGITVRPERSIAGAFTVPIARGGVVVLLRRPSWAPRDGGVRELDRKELRVVVNRGGHLEHVAHALFHDADVRAIPDNAAVRDAFARGDADAAMTTTFEAPRWSAGLTGVETLGPLTSDVTAIWVRAERDDVVDALDDWLLRAERDGVLGDLRARWLGPGGGGATATPLEALLAATAERLALMPFVAAAKQKSGKAIEDAAQEERVLADARAAVDVAASRAARPAPPREAIDAFFRAQMEAAKQVQRRAPVAEATWDLGRDLRPAIARVTRRMTQMVVRLDRAPEGEIRDAARRDLRDTGLDEANIDRLSAAIAALAPR